MSKQKLFLDFDCTICNSIKAICDIYDDDYSAYMDFQPVNWMDVDSWNFKELTLANREELDRYFNTPRFFETVEFLPYAEKTIEELKKYYDVTVVSMGDYPNLALKEHWVSYYLDCKFIGREFSKYSDKSSIDMSGGILLDDSSKNLITSNALQKFCFGREYSWNKDWDGERLRNWTEVYERLVKGRSE